MGLFDFLKPKDIPAMQEKQTKEDEPMEEEIKCKDCGKKLEEENKCYNCDENFCNDCLDKCNECEEYFCEECLTSEDHSCGVKFEVIISFRNTNDDLTISYDIKKEAKDAFARIREAIKAKQEYIEEQDCFILVNEIKYVDMRL